MSPYRGFARMQIGDYEGAFEDFSMELENDPQNLAAYNDRGQYVNCWVIMPVQLLTMNRALRLMPTHRE